MERVSGRTMLPVSLQDAEHQNGGVEVDAAGPARAHGKRKGFDDLIEFVHGCIL